MTRLQRYISENSIISIGTTSKVFGCVEDFEKILNDHKWQDLYMRVGIDSNLRWTQRLEQNKITDTSIIEVNKILIDLDLRKDYQKKTGKILSDEEIINLAKELKDIIDAHDLFKQWSFIVASGNWIHIHYIGRYMAISKQSYSKRTQYFFDKFDEEILHKSSIFSEYKVDQANKNISRLVRIIGSINQRTFFPELWPIEVKILYEQDVSFTFLEDEIQYPVVEKIENISEVSNSPDQLVIHSKEEVYIYKNMRKEFIDYICKKTWLYLKDDGKNFWWWNNDGNKSFFMHETINKLITPEDSPYFKKSSEWFYTFVTFVEAFELVRGRKWAIDFIMKKYHKNNLSSAKVFTGNEEVDFETQYAFTWGLKKIDNQVGRFHTGNLILLVWRAAVWKTEYTFHMAKQNALRWNKVVYITMEMTSDQMVLRNARKVVWISKQDWTDKNITETQKEEFKKYYSYIASMDNLKIASFENNDIVTICNNIIELSRLGYRLIFLDNLWFITDWNNDNELEVFAKVSRELKKITNKYPVSIVLLHHLKKSFKKDENKPGSTSDIRWNQKLSDDADKVIQIWRNMDPEIKDETERKAVYFIQHKDREFGDICTVQFYFIDWSYYDEL
jgi:KaiC/GvpD/RAD55 family RecA-like ATPase